MAETVLSSITKFKIPGPVLLLSCGHGATHWVAATIYILLPMIKEQFGLSYAQAGLFLTVFHISSFAANFASGIAVDMSGRRVAVQIASLIVGGMAIVGFGLTGVYFVLYAMIGFIGAAVQSWHPGALSYLASEYPTRRGYVLAIHALGANAGDAVAPLVAGILLLWLNWQTTAFVAAVPAFIMAALLAVTLLRSDAPSGDGGKRGMTLAVYLSGYVALLRNRAVMGLTMTAGLRTMAQVGLFTFLPLYIADVMHQSTVFMGTTLMAMQLAGMFAAPIAGHWSDRAGRLPIVFGALALTSVMILGLTFVADPTVYVAGISLMGFFLFAIRPVIQSWMMDLVQPEFTGSATSVMFGVQSLLGACTPLLGGFVADSYGLVTVFYMLAGIMIFANVFVVMLPRSGKDAVAQSD